MTQSYFFQCFKKHQLPQVTDIHIWQLIGDFSLSIESEA